MGIVSFSMKATPLHYNTTFSTITTIMSPSSAHPPKHLTPPQPLMTPESSDPDPENDAEDEAAEDRCELRYTASTYGSAQLYSSAHGPGDPRHSGYQYTQNCVQI